jgi:hypothetical protein
MSPRLWPPLSSAATRGTSDFDLQSVGHRMEVVAGRQAPRFLKTENHWFSVSRRSCRVRFRRS